MPLPTVEKKYMSDGNNPEPIKGAEFPVLQLSDGGRIVGRKGQSHAELIADAQRRGQID